MSSKNPFRQSVQPPATPTSPPNHRVDDFAAVFDVSHANDPGQRRSSKTKRVRIQTPPPLSPESTRSSIFLDEPSPSLLEPEGRYLGSLPSELTADDSSDSTVDASETRPQLDMSKLSMIIQDRETMQNTRLNTSLTSSSESEQITTTHIPNPFHRTLATIEPKDETSRPDENDKSQPRAEGKKSDGISRPPMDVDTFKRLLLTGSTGMSHLEEASSALGQPIATNAIDYGSGTDTSSLSRQSINDPNSSTQSDTSRTSYEAHPSDLDDSVQRSSTSQREAKKPAPPPPKPRRGKPIATSASKHPMETSSPTTIHSHSPLAGMNNAKVSTILDSGSTPQDIPPNQLLMASPKVSESRPKPPAPPLARRTSNRTISSISGSVPVSSDSPKGGPSQKRAAPPPPPPTRRSAASASALSSVAALGRSPSDASAQSVNETESDIAANRPRSSSRSSSIVSGRSMPPPVPPSRQRGSSRGSMDAPSPADERPGKRLSTEIDRVVEERPADDADQTDWMADMDALQADVDALKNQYRHTP